MKVHTDSPYKCSLCNKSFRRSNNLQAHKHRMHSNIIPSPYYEGPLVANSQLKLRVRTHTGAKIYSRRHCSERFTWLYQLRHHLLESHNEGTLFTCYVCQKKYSHSGSLKAHVRRHEGVKPYVCCECQKCFHTSGELRNHQLVHSDYRQYCCGSCGQCFKQAQSVIPHVKRCSVKRGFVAI